MCAALDCSADGCSSRSCKPGCLQLLQVHAATPDCYPHSTAGPITAADVGAVGPDGRPTEQGLRQGVGSSTFMNVCINKLLSHCAE